MTLIELTDEAVPEGAIFVIRGDLRSNTGYGKATRALASLLGGRFSVVGVDIHFNPHDQDGGFDFPVITDHEVAALARTNPNACFVLHYTTPDTFLYVDGATNIGCFYWESGRLPHAWLDLINAMDRIWAPTTFVKDVIAKSGYVGAIDIVTWPHDFNLLPDDAHRLASVPGHVVANLAGRPPQAIDIATVVVDGPLFMAVQSLAPRKGLPILLSEWRDYLAGGGEGWLLLKLRFIHSTYGHGLPWERLAELLTAAGFRPGDTTSIILVSEDLSEAQMETLYARADAYVTATYGEGFGGPTIEALQRSRAVIAPRATGALDLLAPDYALNVEVREMAVGLRGGLSVYPQGSTWQLPVKGSIVRAFTTFARASDAERQTMVENARTFAAQFCSIPQVQRQLDVALTSLGGVLS